MKDQAKANSRRKAVKQVTLSAGAIGSASALPSKWVAPAVSSVILPSHATTTCNGQLCNDTFSWSGDYDAGNSEGAGYYGDLRVVGGCVNPSETIDVTVPGRMVLVGQNVSIQYKPESNWVQLFSAPAADFGSNFSFSFPVGAPCTGTTSGSGLITGVPFEAGSAAFNGSTTECCPPD